MIRRAATRFGTIVDDRGRTLTLLRNDILKSMGDEVPDELERRVRRMMLRGYFGRLRWRLVALVAILILLVMSLLWINPFVVRAIGVARISGWAGLIMPVVCGAGIWLIVTAALQYERFAARRRGLRLLAREGHCLRCLYSLRGIPPQKDGCTVCPECGAAWRLAPETEKAV